MDDIFYLSLICIGIITAGTGPEHVEYLNGSVEYTGDSFYWMKKRLSIPALKVQIQYNITFPSNTCDNGIPSYMENLQVGFILDKYQEKCFLPGTYTKQIVELALFNGHRCQKHVMGISCSYRSD